MELLKSKTFWTGIVAIVTGVGIVVQAMTSGNASTTEYASGAQMIITGLVAIFVKSAIVKVEK